MMQSVAVCSFNHSSLRNVCLITAGAVLFLGLASSIKAQQAPALAAPSVGLYGVIDLGWVHERGGSRGAVNKIATGVQAGSRLGFKGQEDLGDGLKAQFVAETGFCADGQNRRPDGTPAVGFCTGDDTFMGRQVFVGLSGNFGAVNLGRQYVLMFHNLAYTDPFNFGTAGNLGNLANVAGIRQNNAIIYTSPTYQGFTGAVLYAPGEVAGNSRAGKATGFSLTYIEGPWYLGVAQHHVRGPANLESKATGYGAIYNFGAFKLHGYYADNKSDVPKIISGVNPLDNTDSMVGVSVPVSRGDLFASYVLKTDRLPASQDAHQIGVGYQYKLSSRTNLYVAYAKITNKNGASYTVGNATEPLATGNAAYNLGIKHLF